MAWGKKKTDKPETDANEQINSERRAAANKFRYEIAEDISPAVRFGHVNKSYGKADYTSGYLVKRMIEAQERQMQNQGK